MSELRQEIKRNRQLIHPGILRVYDLVEEADWAAISMDWFEGETLAALLQKQPGGFEVKETEGWLRQICQTLEDAHKINVVHRNLAPRNVLVDAAGKVLLAKFGISRVIEDAYGRLRKKEAGERHLTYVSPQQLDGEPPNKLDDIYSLGVTVFELLTGQPPFAGSDIVTQIRRTAPPAMGERRAKSGKHSPVPPTWEKTIAACLAKAPTERPQSVTEVARGLELGAGGKAATAEKPVAEKPVVAPATAASTAGTTLAAASAASEAAASATDAAAPKPENAPAPEKKKAISFGERKSVPAVERGSAAPARETAAAPAPRGFKTVSAEDIDLDEPLEDDGGKETGAPDIYPSLYPQRRNSFPVGLIVVLVLLAIGAAIYYAGWKERQKAAREAKIAQQTQAAPDELAIATPARADETPAAEPKAPAATPFVTAGNAEPKGLLGEPTLDQKSGKTAELPPEVATAPPATPAPAAAPEPSEPKQPEMLLVKNDKKNGKKGATPEPAAPEPATPAPAGAGKTGDAAVATWQPGQKPASLDQARAAADAAEKAYQDALKQREAEEKNVAVTKKALEDRKKALGPNAKAAEDLLAQRKKQADILKAAEDAAREARQAAEEQLRMAEQKGHQVDEAKKNLTDWEKQNEKKLKAFEQANTDLQTAQTELDQRQKAAEDAAKRIADAEAARKQAQAALKASEEEARLMAAREAEEAQKRAAAEKATKRAEIETEMQRMMKEFRDRLDALEKSSGTPGAPASGTAPPAPAAAPPSPPATPAPAPAPAPSNGKKKSASTEPAPGSAVDVTPVPPASATPAAAPVATSTPTPKPATPAPAPAPQIAIVAPTPAPPAPKPEAKPEPAKITRVDDLALPTGKEVMPSSSGLQLALANPPPGPKLTPSGPDAGGRATFEASLEGLKFAPVGDVLFCTYLVRVKDFAVFAKETNFKPTNWRNPGFEQKPDHPVVNVSWNDAMNFCKWLTERDRKSGLLQDGEIYRLPTDLEWSKAVGLPEENGKTPELRDIGVPDVYPWGTDWPPPPGAGNYTGEETLSEVAIKGFEDGFVWTSPVGSFPPNKFGLYDMGGNVCQWVLDDWNADGKAKVLRGGSWYNGAVRLSLLSSCRTPAKPDTSTDNYGFRIVKATEAGTEKKKGKK